MCLPEEGAQCTSAEKALSPQGLCSSDTRRAQQAPGCCSEQLKIESLLLEMFL